MRVSLPCSTRFRSQACETAYRESCLVDSITPIIGSASLIGAGSGSMTSQCRVFHWRAHQGLIFVQEESFEHDLLDNSVCFQYGGALFACVASSIIIFSLTRENSTSVLKKHR